MPLYEFRCPNGHDFEKFYRSIGSAPQTEVCPECGERAEKLMSAAGLVFKGSGFYITDYGKDGKKAEREAASKPAQSKSEAKSETPKTDSSPAKADAKPEAKPATPKKTE
jgi:putative FmdB family regulatory protein